MTESDPRFRVVRRGYDRSSVDEHLTELGGEIDALRAERDRLEQQIRALDLAPAADVKAEIDAVQGEVGRILQTAREAAEAMRARAADDAARWRSEADTDARSQRDTAQQDAERVRGEAWDTGTELLTQASGEAARMIEAAKQDSLFIRAEAEREALRLTADARREAEELLRTGRTEGERVVDDARTESQRILADARQSAEAAHERARALEERRTRLLEEIETTRSTMSQLERELDARRDSLQYAGVDDLPEMPRPQPEAASSSEAWGEEGGAVRIVTATAFTGSARVDADELADEVRRMRQSADEAVASLAAEESILEPEEATEEPVTESGPDQPGEEDSGAVDAGADEAEAVEVEEAEVASTDEEPVGTPDDEEPAAEEIPDPEPSLPAGDEEVDAVSTEENSSELSALFDRLREPPAEAEVAPAAPGPEETVEQPEPVAAAVAVAPEPGTPADLAADPVDVRDKLLLPIENRALRAVKRRLVDLQNQVLEDLRVAGGAAWQPDPAMFTAAFSDELGQLAREAVVAGTAGAAELQGESTPRPPAVDSRDAAADFVGGLVHALEIAHTQAATPGAGARKISSSISKVFRAWRTDEAERRLRAVARGAYHRGLVAGFEALGVVRVVGVASGTPCEECPAATGAGWGVRSDPPAGTVLPPATPACACTVVPAR